MFYIERIFNSCASIHVSFSQASVYMQWNPLNWTSYEQNKVSFHGLLSRVQKTD